MNDSEMPNSCAGGSPLSAGLGRGGDLMSEDELVGAVVRATPIFASGEYLAQMCGEIDRLRAALREIADWEMPPTATHCEAYHHMRAAARAALDAAP